MFDEVVTLARGGMRPGISDDRGADEQRISSRDLEIAVVDALAKARRPVPKRIAELMGTKSRNTDDTRSVTRYLYWLPTAATK